MCSVPSPPLTSNPDSEVVSPKMPAARNATSSPQPTPLRLDTDEGWNEQGRPRGREWFMYVSQPSERQNPTPTVPFFLDDNYTKRGSKPSRTRTRAKRNAERVDEAHDGLKDEANPAGNASSTQGGDS
uniref:Uncharacterized protein n=1 Tax=Mycena chlorophos TaxID=658473 RepID=A0ABQ0M4N5_MYCCL|nr:predicted protein [Mycena chlorophos]